jgi:hypothetical protein
MQFLSIAIAILLSFFTYAEESTHNESIVLESQLEKHSEKTGIEKDACWHAQLMQLNSDTVNSPETVPNLVLERAGKTFKYNNKPYASTEMSKGSRMDVFQTSDACDLVIAFRGTYNSKDSLIVDLMQDFYFASPTERLDYHPGFVDVANSYKRNIKQVLAEARTKCGREDLNITVTGQSLGGAVAYVVANIFKDVNLGNPELVLFGSPRVVRQSSKHVDRVKAVHYYLDKDPVVLAPPGIMFRELTDNLYRFSKVPITQEVSITGQELIQNHLPSRYADKMSRWCEGKESPVAVKKITHTLRETGFDVSSRVARAAVDAGGKALLPEKNEAGGSLPRISETVETLVNQKDNSKPNPKYFNRGDGKSLAMKLACTVTHLMGSKTGAGRGYYCNKTLGLNKKAKTACKKSCESEKSGPGTCFQGCLDQFHQFCIGNWSCKGEPLAG